MEASEHYPGVSNLGFERLLMGFLLSSTPKSLTIFGIISHTEIRISTVFECPKS